MDLRTALVDSWQRQCAIIDNLASLLDDRLLLAKPSEDGWPIADHLRHLTKCRRYWLGMSTGKQWEDLAHIFEGQVPDGNDLTAIRSELAASGGELSVWLRKNIASEGNAGPYDHPVFFLQHMMWHEGWHAGLIMLALRLAGSEPAEEWEDPQIWGKWRNYG